MKFEDWQKETKRQIILNTRYFNIKEVQILNDFVLTARDE